MQPDRPLDYYINRLFKQLEMQQFASEMEVKRAYRLLVGDLIYKLTTTLRYREGRLTLRFAAAALRQEITYRKESLRLKMNEELKGEVVKKIVVL
ncbi:MAG: DUF721 domain-containing protein [Bacteroidales bacterium]|nr:DUF721 domain-containing protein [Bacteroidales bacterium]